MNTNGPAGKQQPSRSGILHAAATVWLIIGVLVLAGIAIGVVTFARSAGTTASGTDPTPYQAARPQREDAFWTAYQASSVITTKMSRTNAIAVADRMCAEEGSNPGGIMNYAQSRHADTAALQETVEMLRLAKSLCG